MSFAPEDRLLVACSQDRVPPAQRAIARAVLDAPLDWDYVIEASIRHGVSPLFRHGLVQVLDDDYRRVVPPAARAELDDLLERSEARNRRLFAAVAEIAWAFA